MIPLLIYFAILLVFATLAFKFKKEQPAESTFFTYLDKKFRKVIYLLFLLLTVIFLILGGAKIHQLTTSEESLYDQITRNFDITGITIGIIGIIVGFITVIYVERNNEIKSKEIDDRDNKMKDSILKIEEVAGKIESKLTSLKRIDSLTPRFKEDL